MPLVQGVFSKGSDSKYSFHVTSATGMGPSARFPSIYLFSGFDIFHPQHSCFLPGSNYCLLILTIFIYTTPHILRQILPQLIISFQLSFEMQNLEILRQQELVWRQQDLHFEQYEVGNQIKKCDNKGNCLLLQQLVNDILSMAQLQAKI